MRLPLCLVDFSEMKFLSALKLLFKDFCLIFRLLYGFLIFISKHQNDMPFINSFYFILRILLNDLYCTFGNFTFYIQKKKRIKPPNLSQIFIDNHYHFKSFFLLMFLLRQMDIHWVSETKCVRDTKCLIIMFNQLSFRSNN